MKAKVKILVADEFDSKEYRLELEPKERISFGKSGDYEFPYAEDIAKTHFYLVNEGGQVWVADAKSSHGTLLNKQKVDKAPLKKGDIIEFGNCSVEILEEPTTGDATVAQPSVATTTESPAPFKPITPKVEAPPPPRPAPITSSREVPKPQGSITVPPPVPSPNPIAPAPLSLLELIIRFLKKLFARK